VAAFRSPRRQFTAAWWEVISQWNTGRQQLAVQVFRAPRWQLPVQKRAHLGLANAQQFGQRFDVVAIAGQRRLQLVRIGRQRRVDDRGCRGLFPKSMGLFENPREVMLNLSGVLSRSANSSRASGAKMSEGAPSGAHCSNNQVI
jgi:hypothetical protein